MVLDRILNNVLPLPTFEFPPYDRPQPWQIRILFLHKNSRGPRISGRLKTIDLIGHVDTQHYSASSKVCETPPYHAVSYAAGDPKKKFRLQCDGRIFFIGTNLWRALLRLATLTSRARYGSMLSASINEIRREKQDKFNRWQKYTSRLKESGFG
jgi:hypothetical protein